jgi:hypothetical protein
MLIERKEWWRVYDAAIVTLRREPLLKFESESKTQALAYYAELKANSHKYNPVLVQGFLYNIMGEVIWH